MSTIEVVSAALPHFALAIVLIVVFSTWLGLLPPVSTDDPISLILPALTLAIPTAGFMGQVMRETMLDAMEAPFSLSARARGETMSGLYLRHLLRHAILPALTVAGWAFGSLMSGAVVVEAVFARQGIGRTLLTAVGVRDMPLVLGILIVIAAVYCLVTLIVDILSALIDPRVGT
nr:ABC transporter permease [Flaviflexus equikiangi]